MRLWKKLAISAILTGLLVGCNAMRDQVPGSLQVREAALASAAEGMRLDLDIDCRLNGPINDALEHGIPITLVIHLRAQSTRGTIADRRQIELRYFPLTRRYQLRDSGSDEVRSFAAVAYLIDALASLRLPLSSEFNDLPAGTRLTLDVQLDHSVLPGALRLPAMLEPAWRLSAPEYAWTVAAG
ncbi:MAG TPA: DUF4390 domain-containing protein [Dokdonella sp.]|uniref:DUF4390 domain-containing protein n=1 Tax=Dokdonella sp. TaxID=2291710 RepID=UPI002D7EB476|nr:DUF4390 domain-containing protein [Dokdonella sp.]HET9032887.1 DUF4390 domain-containing protein [Dokdonella sp.]